MSGQKITKINNFNTENLTFTEPKVNQVGGKSVQVRTVDGERILIQLPKTAVPYGVSRSRYGDPNSTDGKPSLQVSFRGIENTPALKTMHEKFSSFEETVKKDGLQKNSFSWVKKKKLSSEMADEMYKSNIAKSRDENGEPDGKYPDTIKFKFPTNEAGQVSTLFFDSKGAKDADGNPVQLSSDEVAQLTEHRAMKGYQVKMIVGLQSAWIGASNVGTSWVIRQVMVYRPEGISNKFAFVADSDDDVADESEEEDDEEEEEDDSD